MNHYDLKKGLAIIEEKALLSDQFLSQQQPWTKTGNEQQKILQTSITMILDMAKHLEPFMPETAKTINNHFSKNKIVALKPLFPRLEK